MTEPGESAEETALWRRWRLSAPPVPEGAADGDALRLAAYVEGRLDEAGAEPVEAWLLAHPEALDDLVAARAAATTIFAAAPDAALARAMALIAPRDDKVVPFPAFTARHRAWRTAAVWSGLAASVLVTSLFGFTLGSNAYLDLTRPPAAAESTFHELLDPPSGLFQSEDEESAT